MAEDKFLVYDVHFEEVIFSSDSKEKAIEILKQKRIEFSKVSRFNLYERVDVT